MLAPWYIQRLLILVLVSASAAVLGHSQITSKAHHYHSPGSLHVDSRTGGLNYQYELGGVTAEPQRGPHFILALRYNSLDTLDPHGLGIGWSFNLSRYDNTSQQLILSNSVKHRVEFIDGNPQLQYQKLKNIRIQYSSRPGMLFEITHKSGLIEYLNNRGWLTQQCNAYGECLDFSYDEQSGELTRISSRSNEVNRIEVSMHGGYRVVQADKVDGSHYETHLAVSQQKLSLIATPNAPNTGDIGFSYTHNKNRLINEIHLPDGSNYTVEYTELPVPTGGPVSYVPAVSRLFAYAGQGQPGEETLYCYV
ncbi:hypothetical protein AB835_04815 [Candidatus Endobugula sertula]|uniref:YD repeat-containing protein n=1 Tax=Candidatus Endobugula sertula TaxID=62101 RepID=A0A1D2QRI8_9GAMM|nr:hypothetical protein AB835_04815 [Candidatus Endobugula sertula]